MRKWPFVIKKVDPQFDKELKAIKLERIKTGADKEMKSDRRLTKAILKHTEWEKIKFDMINAKMEDE